VYKLEDLDGEEIKGLFYEEELSEYNADDTLFQVKKILKKKRIKGKTYALITWKGYSDKFNSWEPLEEV